ncbi:hypothetical protein MBRA_34840 [Mycobacterium branderi]|uniref:PE family protein n=1 Tax=Mycobacterium branderi TaxID=43348 RepID=A0ABN6B9A5_9MYCO|nr:hypothetical protein MBRA_34840 [Mycobacterium branderi]
MAAIPVVAREVSGELQAAAAVAVVWVAEVVVEAAAVAAENAWWAIEMAVPARPVAARVTAAGPALAGAAASGIAV